MSVMQEKFKAIADKIREKLGITDLIKPNDFVNKIDEVYEAGKKAEYDEFWDNFQKNGNREDYQNGFYGWSIFKTIDTKYPVKTETLYSTFMYCRELEVLPTVLFPDRVTGFRTCYTAFSNCHKLKSIDFDVVNNSTASSAWDATFTLCYELKAIQKLVVLESQVFKMSTFKDCIALEKLTIEGIIGQNGFDIHWSTKLTANSLYSIINALSTTTTGLSITLPTTAKANYNANPPEGAPATWAELIETRPNWTIAYA